MWQKLWYIQRKFECTNTELIWYYINWEGKNTILGLESGRAVDDVPSRQFALVITGNGTFTVEKINISIHVITWGD